MLTWQQFLENINPKICIIMRGLPGSGKSSVIHKLLNQYGITYEGHVFSTDNQWIPETIARRKAGENIGDDFEHAEYQKNYDSAKSGGAHLKNINLFKKAVDQGVTPVIIDNTNIIISQMKPYIEYAKANDYKVIMKYPESDWWKQYYPMLANKAKNINELDQFAKLLASKNKHGVPYEVIKDMIQKWHHNPQIDEI